MTTVLLIRHAEPAEEARGRCYGSLDEPLSRRGHEQAGELSAALAAAPIRAVYTSPRRRAVDTAGPVASALGLVAVVEPGLRELDFGTFEGRTYDELAAAEPELFRQWMESPTAVRFPGGESYRDLVERAVACLGTLLERHPVECVAAVSHGGVVRALLAHCLGVPDERIFRLGQDHAAVSVIRWIDRSPIVELVNGPAAAAAEAVMSR